MTLSRAAFKFLATLLVVSVQMLLLPAPLAAAPGALGGFVLSADPARGLPGAVVYAADSRSGEVFASSPTAEDGRFALPDLPPGTYELAVESAGRLYTVGTAVPLAGGQTLKLNLKLDRAQSLAPGFPASESHGVWNNPVTATLLVVGVVGAVALIIDSTRDDSSEGNMSPF